MITEHPETLENTRFFHEEVEGLLREQRRRDTKSQAISTLWPYALLVVVIAFLAGVFANQMNGSCRSQKQLSIECVKLAFCPLLIRHSRLFCRQPCITNQMGNGEPLGNTSSVA
jgi:hypothetical protein